MLISCKEKSNYNSASKTTSSNESSFTISLQPFNDIDNAEVKFVQQQLLQVYKTVTIKDKITVPKQAYYKERNRYRADTIINMLNKMAALNEIGRAHV